MPRTRTMMFRRMIRCCVAGAFLLAWPIAIAADTEEIKFIANGSVGVSEIPMEELKRIFLLKSNTLRDGSRIVPVVGQGSPAYEIFLSKYLGRTDAALRIYYRSLVFTGKAYMPKVLSSDAEVVNYVMKTKDAIGYVRASANTEGLTSIRIR